LQFLSELKARVEQIGQILVEAASSPAVEVMYVDLDGAESCFDEVFVSFLSSAAGAKALFFAGANGDGRAASSAVMNGGIGVNPSSEDSLFSGSGP